MNFSKPDTMNKQRLIFLVCTSMIFCVHLIETVIVTKYDKYTMIKTSIKYLD